MNEMLTALEQKETARLKLLMVVYDKTAGDPDAAVNSQEVFAEMGLSHSEGRPALQYLSAEGLVTDRGDHRISISHAGVKECETAIRTRGTVQTAHFSQQAIDQVIMRGSFHGAAPIGRSGDLAAIDTLSGAQPHALSSLLTQLHEHASVLPERDREVALEHVTRLQRAASSKSPDTVRMRVWLKGLEAFAPLIPAVGRVLEALADVGV
ncbi:MAG: hypothetical protein ABTD50_01465 [Polyangiaceae bacterium]|jgi:hypothetical protein